jgi:ribosome biogenesis protein BMS1
VQGGKDGSYRATFEDKPLMSDIVFLRAWVAVELPRFYNPVTNLLVAPDKRHTPGAVQRAGHKTAEIMAADAEQEQEEEAAEAADDAGAGAAAGAAGEGFQPAKAFTGARAGHVFKLGCQGLGYYPDAGPAAAAQASARTAAAGKGSSSGTAAAGGAAAPPPPDGSGWLGLRTVAELRRELGVGAPRNQDSLYKDVERLPKVFNPLRIPKALQVGHCCHCAGTV